MDLEKIEINADFEEAIKKMEDENTNLFITGKAGAGKSTLLSYFCKNTKKEYSVLKHFPQYNETKTKKNLGKVINSLKSEISAYELDNVNISRNELVVKTARVNERIYGKTCELLKQSLHPVIIANILFGNWVRLSTIGNNMPEESYQKI
ncbi:ATP-binding cassette domain-containing protein [Rickettsiales endosymbiont of Trichoplax sp. H2]|uniref:ATP-binding cassette domain-containing protein n=1 Tax=Rickettsiales endosymbiont of Trichoplax sp. H2 TaxID=2021221 RepID=UPI0012B3CB1B|nr:ATP-binding cassette domain-containing protein [Rickettsiales endosymbiont of Trichoplax sp. H2]MSO14517.1 hypothetical protein [Rickettsiales endosymbiont of Trichoplax sp. H2]